MNASSLVLATAAAAVWLVACDCYAADEETKDQEDVDDEVGPLSRVGSYPLITGMVPFQINNDYTFDSSDSGNFNTLSTDTEPLITVSFIEPNPETLVLSALFVLQGVGDLPDGEDTYFKSTGLFIQDLNLTYGDGRWEVMAGKFTPNFGRAWNLAPDIYGQNLPQDYEFDEQIGFGGSYTIGNGAWGFHTLSGSAFFQDTTILSESLITNRGRTKKSDGGVGNTEDPQSFALAYDGNALPVLPGIFDYQLGMVRRAKGEGDDTSEYGYVASADLSIPLNDGVEDTLDSRYSEFNPLIEFVYFDDADGVRGQDRYYITGSADLVYGDWDFGAAYTFSRTDTPGSGNEDDYIVSAQAGYTFRNSFQIEVGWNHSDVGGVRSQTIGTQITYEYDF